MILNAPRQVGDFACAWASTNFLEQLFDLFVGLVAGLFADNRLHAVVVALLPEHAA
jgi:hypothetical protein